MESRLMRVRQARDGEASDKARRHWQLPPWKQFFFPPRSRGSQALDIGTKNAHIAYISDLETLQAFRLHSGSNKLSLCSLDRPWVTRGEGKKERERDVGLGVVEEREEAAQRTGICKKCQRSQGEKPNLDHVHWLMHSQKSAPCIIHTICVLAHTDYLPSHPPLDLSWLILTPETKQDVHSVRQREKLGVGEV